MKKATIPAHNKPDYFYPVTIVLLAFFLYVNTTRNQYCIDDNLVVLNEMVQKGIKAIPEIFTSRYQTAGTYYYGYRPLGKATFAIEQSVFGRNPVVSHFINVLIYTASCLVLWLVLKKILTGYNHLFIFCVVALFTAHPVHTEAVASLKNREELLCFLFSFLSLYNVILFREKTKIRYLAAGILFLLFGFLSKQNAVSFVLIIPLTLMYFRVKTAMQGVSEAGSPVKKSGREMVLPAGGNTLWTLVRSNFILLAGILLCLGGGVLNIEPLMAWSDIIILFSCVVRNRSRDRLVRLLRNGWFLAGILTIPVAVVTDKPAFLLSAFFFINAHYSFDSDLRLAVDSLFRKTGQWLMPGKYFMLLLYGSLKRYRFPVIFFIVLAIIASGILFIPDLFLPAQKRELHAFENPLFGDNEWFSRIALGFYSLLVYLKLLFYPHPLLFYYGYKHIPDASMTDPLVIISVLIHVGMGIASIFYFNSHRILSYAILFYLCSVFLVSNIPALVPGIVAERLLFLPSIGFCIAVSWLIFRIFRVDPIAMKISPSTKGKIFTVIILILIPYSIKTFSRNRDWKDEMTLFTHDIPYLKNSLHANVLYASQLVMRFQGQPANRQEANETIRKATLALRHFKLALAVDSTHVKTLVNTGTLYYQFFHRYDSAEYFLYKALKYDSLFSLGWFNLGICYEWQSKPDKAIPCYMKAHATDSLNINLLSNLATAYYNSGQWDNAVITNQKIMTVNPSSDIPYLNMGSYYLAAKDEDSAAPWLEKAVEKNSGNKSLCIQLGNYFKDKGNQQKASYYINLANKK